MAIKKLILLILVTCTLAPISAQVVLRLGDTIAYVDDTPITYQEFHYFINKNRASVIRHFGTTHGLKYQKGFWQEQANGTSPAQELKNKALDEAVKMKVQQILAQEQGLMSDISYTTFLDNWTKENQRRTLAVKNKKVIYGPMQYTEKGYFDYVWSNLLIALKKELAKEELSITDKKLKTHYESIKQSLFHRGYYTKAEIVAISHNEVLEKQLRQEISALKKDQSLLEILKTTKYKNLVFSQQRIILNDTIYQSEEQDFSTCLVQECAKMHITTGTCQPVAANDSLYIVIVEQREDLGCKSFEKSKLVVKDRYTDLCYDALVTELINQAQVNIIHDRMDQLETF